MASQVSPSLSVNIIGEVMIKDLVIRVHSIFIDLFLLLIKGFSVKTTRVLFSIPISDVAH